VTKQNLISLNQPLGMSAKVAANEIRTHARTNQRRTLEDWNIARFKKNLNA